MEKIIDKKSTMEVWENTKNSKAFKELHKEISKALFKYKDSNEEDLEIDIKLRNQYLGKLY